MNPMLGLFLVGPHSAIGLPDAGYQSVFYLARIFNISVKLDGEQFLFVQDAHNQEWRLARSPILLRCDTLSG